MSEKILIELLIWGQGFVILLLTVGIKGIFSINAHLAKLNGRMGRMEEWTDGHEKLDDEHHKENLGKFDSIFSALNRRR